MPLSLSKNHSVTASSDCCTLPREKVYFSPNVLKVGQCGDLNTETCYDATYNHFANRGMRWKHTLIQNWSVQW